MVMNILDEKLRMLALLLLAAFPIGSAPGQAPQAPEASPETKEAKAPSATRPAKVLFDEADSYINKRFEEFKKQKLPYNQELLIKKLHRNPNNSGSFRAGPRRPSQPEPYWHPNQSGRVKRS